MLHCALAIAASGLATWLATSPGEMMRSGSALPAQAIEEDEKKPPVYLLGRSDCCEESGFPNSFAGWMLGDQPVH